MKDLFVLLVILLCGNAKIISQGNSSVPHADSTKLMEGYLVFIEDDVNEMMIFPDSIGNSNKLFEILHKSVGYRIPKSENFDIYKLGKIAPCYKVYLKLYPGNDSIVKKYKIKIVKTRIKYRPWNTGMPKSESDWIISYKKEEYILKYIIDLDASIIEAKPVEKKNWVKFNKYN